MVKVLKTSSLELAVDFEEIFDGASVEDATQKAHRQVYAAKVKGRQCVRTLKAFKEYNQLFRRIVEAEHKDARFLYT